MPRVSQNHLDARRRQILDGALRCFTRRGFHTCSMQDVLAEIGLSAGAVYRYFSGKEEIIRALAEEVLTDFTGRMTTQVVEHEALSFADLVHQLPAVVANAASSSESAGMLLQIWAEAPRSAEVSSVANTGFDTMVGELAKLVEVYQERGELDRGIPPEDYARVMVGAIQGFVLQRAVFSSAELVTFQEAFAALVRTSPPSLDPAARGSEQ